MSKNIKKYLSIVLAILMLVSIVPTQLFAVSVEDPWVKQTNATFKDNVFLDALDYLGYDTSRFTVNGEYGSSVDRKYRTNIGFNENGAYGTETSSGKPNVSYFENNGLCCGSYAAYVYFNYLPNVYGLDTSFLTKPSNCRSSTSWATACESWVKNDVAEKVIINKDSDEDLSALKNVPIGSVILFKNANGNYCHTGIYAGYKVIGGKTYYFQTQCGGSKGPEVQQINDFYYYDENQQSVYQTVYAVYTPDYDVPNPTGAVGVYKVDDAGNPVANVKIGVYSDSTAKTKVAEITTDSTGKATYGYSGGEYILDVDTTYYFKEISAPAGYDLSTQIVSAKVVADKVTYASTKIVDNRQGKISVAKYSDSGDKLGAGYVFGIYSDKSCTKSVATLTTNANGTATTGYLTSGTYYVKETALPETDTIHELNTNVYTVVVGKGETVQVNSGKFVNERKRGDVEVIKVSEDGIVADLEFHLYGTSDSGEAVDMTAKTDKNGKASFKDVLIGTYTVEEVNTPDRYVAPESQSVTVKNNDTATVTFNNVLKRFALQITKTDAETGKNVAYAGAGFQIYNEKDNLIKINGEDTFYTDSNGQIVTSKALAFGKYYIVEVQAPEGYILDDTPVEFDINSMTVEIVDGVQLVKVVKSDYAQKGTITIAKQGEVFSTVIEEDGSYLPVFALKNLSGATYEITSTEDIITPDGSVRVKKGTVVATLTTSADGVVTSAPLYLGKYTVTEIEAPEGYVLNSEPVDVEITYAGQNIDIAVQYVSFTNDRQKIQIDLTKTLEQDDLFGIGMNSEILNVKFALYAAEDIVAEDDTLIPIDGLIEIASCDENGKITFTTDVPFGNYYVKEYSTDEQYVLSDTKYPIEFKYDGQDKSVVSVVVNDGVDITNDIIRGTIVGQKLNEDGNGVADNTFGLFKADETEFTEENAIMISTSNEIGEFFFENVPYGTWIVRELKVAEGYILNEQVYFATISENEELVEVVVENEFIKGSVQVSKVDSNNKDALLEGAVFEIYIDADGDKQFNADIDVLVGTLTESSTGIHTMADLRYGGYFVYEKTAPEGYTKSDEYVYFEIVEDGKTVEIVATNEKIIVPEIPNTDGEENAEKDNLIDTVCLIVTVVGGGFMLILGYFFVLQPKLKSKKKGYSRKNPSNKK